ncbi:N-acetylmuramoyl-L-alanine amidase [Puia sp. P3]|uniref:N-acetylmuramoyl-L-alanine amidase n=1 Tax=Puia sp. P3 TaxID=3423952 RepID=UPI003D66DFA2
MVQNEFTRSGRRSEGVVQRQVGIGVLQATGMPSVLIETGYLTNKEERTLPEQQKRPERNSQRHRQRLQTIQDETGRRQTKQR